MTLKITGKWIIVGLFLALETILVIIYNYHDEHDRSTIAFAATVLGGAFALYTYLEGLDERRVQYANRLIERWNDAKMLTIRQALTEVMEGRLDPMKLVRHDSSIQEQRMCIVTALNFYEEVSIAVLKKSANEERLQDFFDAIVKQSFSKLEDWIKNERKIDNQLDYYIQFERLASKWKIS